FKLGGGSFEKGNTYYIPYVFSDWSNYRKYDAFSHMAVTGSRVNVRNKPDLHASSVLGQITYEVVKVNYDKSFPLYGTAQNNNKDYVGDKLWYYIESLDGRLKGYIYWEFVWSPISHRLGLNKIDGIWQITFLVAGD
ncbi:MAG: hypothetical protein AAGC85_25590, partial [Bacteroidota bacterium]